MGQISVLFNLLKFKYEKCLTGKMFNRKIILKYKHDKMNDENVQWI